jgi:hypothetical protein
MAWCFLLGWITCSIHGMGGVGSLQHRHGVISTLDMVVHCHSQSLFLFEEIPEQCSNCKVVGSTRDSGIRYSYHQTNQKIHEGAATQIAHPKKNIVQLPMLVSKFHCLLSFRLMVLSISAPQSPARLTDPRQHMVTRRPVNTARSCSNPAKPAQASQKDAYTCAGYGIDNQPTLWQAHWPLATVHHPHALRASNLSRETQ